MLNSWHVYFTEVITGRRRGPFASLLRGGLRLLSWGYQTAVAGRNWGYDKGYFCRYYPPVPLVISIGNIVAGGTGKTPVTLMIAKEFYPDVPLAILSRGYKSRAEKMSKPVVLCKGEGPIHPAEYCGDEPYLLAQHLPKAHIIVGRNRYAASNIASHDGAKVILLDDGMQHRTLERDLEVVVVNALDAFGQGYFLPRGFLREDVRSLSRADLIIINRVSDIAHFEEVSEKLIPYTKAPAVGTKMEVSEILDCNGNAVSIAGKTVGIFCGIADPLQFKSTVESQGAHVVAHKFSADHEAIQPLVLEEFADTCHQKGADILVCTEKDYVKLSYWTKTSLPIVWLRMHLSIVAGEPNWRAFISKAKADLARRI